MRPHIQNLSVHSLRVHRDLALLVLIVAASAIPFLSQPFHMDDNFYMDMARNARAKPFFPHDLPYVFEGRSLPDMGSHSHPPFQTYFLAILQYLAGEGAGKEWIFHSFALVFPMLAVLAFYFLCARLVERPLWPSLLLAACPLFMVTQHSLMADIPTLSFWLSAIVTFLYAMDKRNGRMFAVSSVFQFAAMFTSYQSFSIVPLLGFYQIRKRGGRQGWIALFAPVLAMAAWFGMNYLHYHRVLLGDTLGYIKSREADTLIRLGAKLVAAVGYQGWLIIFPLFILCGWARTLRGRLAGLVLIVVLYLSQIVAPHYRLVDKMILVVGLVTGIFVIIRMGQFFLESMCERDNSIGMSPIDAQFLGLWYFGVLFYCVFVLTEGSARYILPMIPPVLLCFFRGLEIAEASEYRAARSPLLSSAMLASGSLVLSIAWGLLLSHADLEFARVYSRAARDFLKISAGMNSYYAGEWGFRYYFERSGVKQLPVNDSLVSGGSWLAWPKLALPYDSPKVLMSMSMPVQTLSYEPGTPIRLLDKGSNAGFYSTGWGLLPFSLSRKALEEIEIHQVNFMVEALPRAQIQMSGTTSPWPGFLNIPGRSPLGILMKPGTTVTYPWRATESLELDIKCGVGIDAYTVGLDRRFSLAIVQRDAQGSPISAYSKVLIPGLQPVDRKWQPVRLHLRGNAAGAGSLEFSCYTNDPSALGTIAFSEAMLRHP